jgi:hypothetical protein
MHQSRLVCIKITIAYIFKIGLPSVRSLEWPSLTRRALIESAMIPADRQAGRIDPKEGTYDSSCQRRGVSDGFDALAA